MLWNTGTKPVHTCLSAAAGWTRVSIWEKTRTHSRHACCCPGPRASRPRASCPLHTPSRDIRSQRRNEPTRQSVARVCCCTHPASSILRSSRARVSRYQARHVTAAPPRARQTHPNPLHCSLIFLRGRRGNRHPLGFILLTKSTRTKYPVQQPQRKRTTLDRVARSSGLARLQTRGTAAAPNEQISIRLGRSPAATQHGNIVVLVARECLAA